MSKLILGTAQFGLDYGINNKTGQISEEKSFEILTMAYENGIQQLDTAKAYGSSHNVIGKYHRLYPQRLFRCITKIPRGKNLLNLNNTIEAYLEELNVSELECLMFHSFEDYKNATREIQILSNDLRIKKVGVSIYTNEEGYYLADDDNVSIVQLPFNLLDNFAQRGNLINYLRERKKEIHARSVFLQGFFFKENIEEYSMLFQLKKELELLKRLAAENNISMEELALQYVHSFNEIDKVIIGVDSLYHIEKNLKAVSSFLDPEIVSLINLIKVEDRGLLNPSLWI